MNSYVIDGVELKHNYTMALAEMYCWSGDQQWQERFLTPLLVFFTNIGKELIWE